MAAPRVKLDTTTESGAAWQEVFDAFSDYLDKGGALQDIDVVGNIYKREIGNTIALEVPKVQGGSDAVPCTAFKVGLDSEGNFTQNSGLFHSSGPKTISGWVGDTDLVDGVEASDNDIVYLKVEYSPVDKTFYSTGWEVVTAEFVVETSPPTDHLLEWDNDTANNWDDTPDGKAYLAWASVTTDENGNLKIAATECGHILCTICAPHDIRISTGVGATITSGFIPPTSDADLADGEVWNDGGTLKIYSA